MVVLLSFGPQNSENRRGQNYLPHTEKFVISSITQLTADNLRYVVTLTFHSLTLNVCSVSAVT